MTHSSSSERCSFCGKSKQQVRSLIEGGCSRGAPQSCVFICDECVTFCAQVNADVVSITHERSDG